MQSVCAQTNCYFTHLHLFHAAVGLFLCMMNRYTVSLMIKKDAVKLFFTAENWNRII